jgi:RTX calcium-binding nonapeptide repeat (4 copies)
MRSPDDVQHAVGDMRSPVLSARCRVRLPRSIAAVAAFALVTAGAAPAEATRFDGNGIDVLVTPDGSGSHLFLRCDGGVLSDASSGYPLPDDTPRPLCRPLQSIRVEARGGFEEMILDAVRRFDFPAIQRVVIDGAGAERVVGSEFDDQIYGPVQYGQGQAGNDLVVQAMRAWGNDGDDWLKATYNPAQLPAALVSGAVGYDVWEATLQGMADGTTVTLDAQSLQLSGGSTTSTPVTGIEQAYVTLAGARHVFNGSGFPGRLTVSAGAGSTVVGGAYADELATGAGNDSITGGAGSDVIRAGAGDDVVYARDGVADTVDCGEGTDLVQADPVDSVVNCEGPVDPVLVPPTGSGVLPEPEPGAGGVPPAPTVQPPDTSAIVGPKKVRKPRGATFTFSSPTPGATFVCRVDKRKQKPCASPYKVGTKKLKKGKHRLRVWAVVGADVDVVGSKHVFKVRKKGRGGKRR